SIFQSSKVSCPDIRAGAALVLVALASPGISEISNIEKIQRGYENFDKKLSSLGAEISLTN
ncbi:MAG TPA: UDP-N-acetylglucosamine 1-carboxyvinyltransferase, partial [Candidatus Nanoarchaeia archaeon]|nr:UDP-N-acetylglucosamine 1-carboxyvinyltransferase [Candidatus Nanoarchaeia archaeon]